MAINNPTTEALALQEYIELQQDPVFQGAGLPRGDGTRVVVLPGLFANDLYLSAIRVWLSRIGYQPITSDILWNVGCPKRLLSGVTDKVTKLLQDEPSPIAILGHSRGGLLAKALASRFAATCKA